MGDRSQRIVGSIATGANEDPLSLQDFVGERQNLLIAHFDSVLAAAKQ